MFSFFVTTAKLHMGINISCFGPEKTVQIRNIHPKNQWFGSVQNLFAQRIQFFWQKIFEQIKTIHCSIRRFRLRLSPLAQNMEGRGSASLPLMLKLACSGPTGGGVH